MAFVTMERMPMMSPNMLHFIPAVSNRPLSMAIPRNAPIIQSTFLKVMRSLNMTALISRTNTGAVESRTAAKDRDSSTTAML